MKILMYDTHNFEKEAFSSSNTVYGHQISFHETKLNEETAALAKGFPCVCAFVNDKLNEAVLTTLSQNGTKIIALRSAGYNHIDLPTAKKLDLTVVRVPEYSPHSVAEFAMTLILSLNRKIHKSYNRVREGNFSLEGLVGFDLYGKTIGVIGTGKIGKAFIQIARGFGCNVLAYDLAPDSEFSSLHKFNYCSLQELLSSSDIISLHVPLTETTKHMINRETLKKMKDNVMIINTGRGGLIDTKALISELKSGKIGAAGLDVYEEEGKYFFEDLSDIVLDDDMLIRLMTFPNMILTSHQAFLTKEALANIADTTLSNIYNYEKGETDINQVI